MKRQRVIEITAGRLAALRREYGFSVAAMGAALNVPPSTLGMMETGRRPVNVTVLRKLRKLFKVDINRFFD